MNRYSSTFCAILFLLGLSACSKKDSTAAGSNIGTYFGSLTVVDDPQTQLGNVTNANVTVQTSGTAATIKITGDFGFDREYTAIVISSQNNSYILSIKNQTRPTSKTVGGDLQISDNKLSFSLGLNNDNISAVKPGSAQIIQLTGKLNCIGSNLLKK